jgi:branched-subunit amino acid aminotransferase/4-amino-4-deoxychorismate lyase
MNQPLAYLNGRLVPFAEALLPLHDAGFVAGAAVVDNARTFRHRVFRHADHLERFRRDCEACFVTLEIPDQQLVATAEELIAHNAKLLPMGTELQLVTFATPGPLGFYLGDTVNGPPTLGMVTYPVPIIRYRRFFTEGATLVVAGVQEYHPGGVLSPTVKHRSRMLWHIADHKARRTVDNPAALGVLLDSPRGSLTETSVANFLAVVDNVVVSPPPETILDGISLRVVRELCGSLGVPFAEEPLPVSQLHRHSEAMLTGTGFCLAPVRALFHEDETPHRYHTPGRVFRRLLAAWSDLVGVDIEGSFVRG